MSARCDHLDEFFDGELSKDKAAAFRVHLAGCKLCQAALRGRAQEEVIVATAHGHAEQPRPITTSPRHRGARRHGAVILPPLLAAAALVIWLVATRDGEQTRPIELSYTTAKHGPVARGSDVHPGDVLRLVARGGRHRAIWMYLDARALVIACPGSAQCISSDDELTLDVLVTTPGQYSIIALGAAEPIVVPHGPLDVRLAAATSAGVVFKREQISVH
jgi:hypothetical protein